MGLIGAAIVEGLQSRKDGSVKIVLGLQEQSPENIGKLFAYNNQFVKFYISSENVSQEIKDVVDGAEIEGEHKAPSKRLRNVLYRYWEVDNKGYEDFNLYYLHMMEKIIQYYKDKLP